MGFRKSSFEPHPAGIFVGTFADRKEWAEGNFGPQMQVSFDTSEVMDDGRPFRQPFWIGEAVNEKSNAGKFFKALGIDITPADFDPEAVDLDEYLGTEVQLVIEQAKAKDGTIKSKVTNLLPVRKAKPRPAANRPAAPRASGGTATLAVDDDEADPFEDQ